LVRAYTEAARVALNKLATERKVSKKRLKIDVPYKLYDVIKRLITANDGSIENEIFTTSVLVTVSQPLDTLAQFTQHLRDASAGQIVPEEIEDS
jgi:putative IMPACT (imprinted ancient) family translation regulator